jgi:hypothetical protein
MLTFFQLSSVFAVTTEVYECKTDENYPEIALVTLTNVDLAGTSIVKMKVDYKLLRQVSSKIFQPDSVEGIATVAPGTWTFIGTGEKSKATIYRAVSSISTNEFHKADSWSRLDIFASGRESSVWTYYPNCRKIP